MNEWKEIKIDGIARIERFVEEFEVYELYKIPYSKFKVKIFESSNGKFIGRTNIMVIDRTKSYYPGIGHGNNVAETLKDTILNLYLLIDDIDNLNNECFNYVESVDF
ncbi:MAG: hypothetical protein IJ763_02160 [Lachnospiraceae bacterium]|nr:hypothetical protein [Lachnospiraceae bacterium]